MSSSSSDSMFAPGEYDLILRTLKHDFGNLLMAIRHDAESVRDDAVGSASSRPEVERMIACVDEAAALLDAVARITAPVSLVSQSVDINQRLANCLPLLQRLLGGHQGVQVELAPKLDRAVMPEGTLEKILFRFFVLAQSHSSSGERMVLRTSAEIAAQKDMNHFVGCVPALNDRCIVVELTGPWSNGVTVDFLGALANQVANPYAYMYFRPVTDQQAVVRIYTRVAVSPSKSSRTEANEGSAAGYETVLVAEDDAGARRVISRMLKDGGYNVLEAEDGASALRAVMLHQGSIDLLLADIMMPDFDGMALAGQIVNLRPEIKVMFISGLTRDELSRQTGLTADGTAVFVQKPFRREELLALVRKVLEGHSRS